MSAERGLFGHRRIAMVWNVVICICMHVFRVLGRCTYIARSLLGTGGFEQRFTLHSLQDGGCSSCCCCFCGT